MMRKLFIKLWEKFFSSNIIMGTFYKNKYRKKHFNIMTSEETIRYVLENNCSVSRFGEGELELIIDETISLGFQERSEDIANKLKLVLNNQNKDLLICLPFALNNIYGRTKHSRFFWFHWCSNKDQRKKHTL